VRYVQYPIRPALAAPARTVIPREGLNFIE
jgi:hypothetical protein